MKSSNDFAQSAVDAQRQRDESCNCSVVGETLQLLANSSYGYQIMDHSHHSVSVSNFLDDGKTHTAIKYILSKRLVQINDQLYEKEPVKSEIEHEEPIIVGNFLPCSILIENVGALLQLFSQNVVAIQTKTRRQKWIQTLSI